MSILFITITTILIINIEIVINVLSTGRVQKTWTIKKIIDPTPYKNKTKQKTPNPQNI